MWVVFGIRLQDIGWAKKSGKDSYEILYLEDQYYPPKLWDKRYVREFEDLDEAIKFASERNFTYNSEGSMRENIKEKFRNKYEAYYKSI